MTIQERLQMIIKMHNLTASSFADKIGVQRSSVSHIMSGRNNPSLDFIEKTVKHFPRVNTHWLITGENREQKQVELQQRSTTSSVPTVNKPEKIVKKEIKRIVVYYTDGTFEER